jgi:pimeloyl-ACP methyl ester carboxylesterase
MGAMPNIEIEGLQLHYNSIEASSPKGPGVLFVHGTGCNGSLWERPMQVLAAAGHECVAIDLPGHGQSSGYGFRGVVDHAHFVARLAEHLGWRHYVLAGHSLGGGVAMAVALYDGNPLAGLLLIDTGARLRVGPGILQSARDVADGVSEPRSDSRFGFAAATSDRVLAEIAALRANEDPAVTYRDWLADDSCDFMSRLRHIAVPTLAICGQEDPLTPIKYHEYFRDHISDCRLEVIPGAGHWPQFEQPEAFDRAVSRFVSERSP